MSLVLRWYYLVSVLFLFISLSIYPSHSPSLYLAQTSTWTQGLIRIRQSKIPVTSQNMCLAITHSQWSPLLLHNLIAVGTSKHPKPPALNLGGMNELPQEGGRGYPRWLWFCSSFFSLLQATNPIAERMTKVIQDGFDLSLPLPR